MRVREADRAVGGGHQREELPENGDGRQVSMYYVFAPDEMNAWGTKPLKHHLVRGRWTEGTDQTDTPLDTMCQYHELRELEAYTPFATALRTETSSIDRLCARCSRCFDRAAVARYRELMAEIQAADEPKSRPLGHRIRTAITAVTSRLTGGKSRSSHRQR